jgi:hypothetical protein
MKKVFISYARPDFDSAKRLFDELQVVDNVHPWLDKESLLPGARWRPAIRKAIRESDYFLALISSNSVSGKGYRNTELTQALEILSEFPPDQIFLIPTRLEDVEPPHDEVTELTFVDMFPIWGDGMKRLLLVIAPGISRVTKPQTIVADNSNLNYHYRVGLVDLDLGLTNLKALAESLNQAQGFFLFTCPKLPSVEEAVGKIEGLTNLKVYDIPASFFSEHPNLIVDLVVCLTRYPLAFEEHDTIIYNYFAGESDEDERFLFVSTDKLYGFCQQAGRSFEEGMVHSVVGQLMNYFTKIGYHKETRGCVMDHCKLRSDQVEGLKSRSFCSRCDQSLPNGELKTAIEALLSWTPKH